MLMSGMIYLFAAVVSVPIAKKLGLGSVLGYLIAGIIIGPYALRLVGDQSDVMHFAEFGVVMMLFLVGLELQPSRLWQMRRPIIGLGGLQVALTGLAIFILLFLSFNMAWQTALALGMTLSLSSTAIVLQSLSERGLLKTSAGNSAFSVLLFQDIAVIPMLSMFPLLALTAPIATEEHHGSSLISGLSNGLQFLIILLTIVVIVVGGKFLSAPIFRVIANTRLREIFTAFALLIVIAIAVLMQSIGLSPALGAFLAGVVLAESEFRHELEIDIEPFKGLLLGLFFITVGASIDIPLLLAKPLLILAAVIGLCFIKVSVLLLLARLFKMDFRPGLLFAVALAQGGEFGFVLITTAAPHGIFPGQIASLLSLVIAISMLISPIMLVIYEWAMSRGGHIGDQQEADEFNEESEVIIAGYGRFGQIAGRLLSAQGYKLTILDHSPSQIDLLRRFGSRVFYGDASREDLLRAAGAQNAKLLVVAVDEPDKTLAIIEVAQKKFPHLKILARSIDRRHTYELMKKNIAGIHRETFGSALQLGVDALKVLGVGKPAADKAGQLFAEHDEQSLEMLAKIWGDDQSYGIAVRQRVEDLKQVLSNDQQTEDFQGQQEKP